MIVFFPHCVFFAGLIVVLLSPSIGQGASDTRPIKPDQVPSRIAFLRDSLYKRVDTVFWSKLDGHYRADFLSQGKNVSLTYNKRGTLIYSRTEVDYSTVPEAIKKRISSEFKGMKIVFAFKSEHKGTMGYDVQLMAGSLVYLVNIVGKEEETFQFDIDKMEFNNPNWLMETQ